MITIATNMAGRGTDIQLGGNKKFLKNNENETPEILEKKIDKEKVKKSWWTLHCWNRKT